MACDEQDIMPEPDDSVLMEFDPPITLYTYKEGQKLQKQGRAPM